MLIVNTNSHTQIGVLNDINLRAKLKVRLIKCKPKLDANNLNRNQTNQTNQSNLINTKIIKHAN